LAKSTQDYRIASLDQKAAAVKNVDLMASGSAIPWEDRGTVGFFVAFFQTAFGVMFKPVAMLSKLRRPETPNDARIFAFACGVIWFLAVIIQSAFAYFVFYANNKSLDVDTHQYMINTILGGILAAVAAAFLPNLVAWMFYRLTAFDMTSKAPPVLVYNCIAFLGGCCLWALIPGGAKPWLAFGPCLVGIWMWITLLIVAIRRLRIRPGAAIIGSILTLIAIAGLVIVGIFVINFLWNNVIGNSSLNAAQTMSHS
jgi:hypothetical protein